MDKTLFQSTTMKNEKVFDLISKELVEMGHRYTATQCRDKLKYLKMRYMKTKDNLKRSDAAPIMFDYLEQMNKYLGEKPNVEPAAIAASSRDPGEISSKYFNIVHMKDSR
jgi:inhibitor of KinA sporulation pathway (predicted exonuclease)